MTGEGSSDQILYLRDGFIVLTENTIAALLEAGVNREVTDRARRGLALTEFSRLTEVRGAFNHLLQKLNGNSASLC